MSIQSLTSTHDITILQPGQTTDSYNNGIDDWDNPTATNTTGWLAQTNTQEVLGNRDAQIVDAVLYLMPDKVIAEHDRVVFAGATYEVVGRPNHAPTPRGINHIEANLREVVG